MANTKISGNGGYSWWTRPLFIQAPTNRYFTAMTGTKKWRAFLNDLTTYDDLDTAPELDDHNAPAIMVRPNKPRHAFFARHAQSTIINHYKASSGINFVDQGNITFTGNTTYSQVVDYGDKLNIFTRSGMQTWRYARSSNWGTTWQAPKRFIDFTAYPGQKYCLITPGQSSGMYHIAAYGHPVGSTWRGMVYGQLDANSGDISNYGGVIANLYSVAGLPLGETDLDDIVPTTGTEVARLFDVGEAHGNPVVLYAKWDDTNSVPAGYWIAYRSGGTWTHVDLNIPCGTTFYAPSRYYGGMSIDKFNGNKLYVSHEASGTWYIDEIGINSDMTIGSTTNIESDSTYPLVRPYAVEGANYVVWQRLIDYTTYTVYSNMEYWTNG